MHRVTIEAFRVPRGFADHDPQRPGEGCDEGEMTGSLDQEVFRLRRQSLRDAFSVVPHDGQVITLRTVDTDRNGDSCERILGERGRIWRHQHDGADTRITDVWNNTGSPRRFPSGGTT